ncbi:TIGR03619 family F420-dependent LLM class oxidoreductase [Nonomuraea glycinis]|uniref:LLM class F420-dependent oxidoreductase n=1 Tax=Nonomuraea glycinis TaxID=2047744 RepID=A0A918A823_9ACTN|nr:TIGR03619 family F420-dependent LLM class oxidoreductase [Nonomuraea glycinis]MCA2182312.1 TIGR03619 family F420-dependent LLM class oxidoreductase [Nonomuraea glycinis]GGP11159.1 LLM class F420-dependent oxidoreductase [Nonomuraea glycinis]
MKFWLGASFVPTDQFAELARAAERCGFDTLTLSDHLFYAEFGSKYPYSTSGKPRWNAETHWPDVWVTIGAMSAVTSTLRFAPNVYIAPARDLITVAKQVSTAAVLSNDRVSFGVGVGWCEEEFAATGQDFHTRGRRLDAMLPVLRELWAGQAVTLDGLPALTISPTPRERVPVLVGGDSEAALKRAARAGDGWIGNRIYTEEQLDGVLTALRGHLDEHGRTGPFEIIAPLAVMPDADTYRHFAAKGVTGTLAAPWWLATPEEKAEHGEGTLALKIATMERFAEEVIAKM